MLTEYVVDGYVRTHLLVMRAPATGEEEGTPTAVPSGEVMQVSVLLPARNAESTLREAVESVLSQTCRDFELVLIDDGSTDGTLAIMEAFARRDSRVRVITHANMGMGASLNHAMAATDAEWVARMDADDVMMPTRLERQLAFVAAHPGIGVASCFVYYINERGDVIARGESPLLTLEDFARCVRTNVVIAVSHPGAFMNRRAVLSVGGYRPQFWPADDQDLWNRVAEAGHPILVQPEYLLEYRVHDASICIAQPRFTMRQIRWVEKCMLARRSGRPEPSLEEFLEAERRAPWPRRINLHRMELAQALYKAATHHYGAARYGRLLLAMGTSLLLEPQFGIRRLWSKVVRYRLGLEPRRLSRRTARRRGAREPARSAEPPL